MCLELRSRCPKLGFNITVANKRVLTSPLIPIYYQLCKRDGPKQARWTLPPTLRVVLARLQELNFGIPLHLDLIVSYLNGWKHSALEIIYLVKAIKLNWFPTLLPSFEQLIESNQWNRYKTVYSALKWVENHPEALRELVLIISTPGRSLLDCSGSKLIIPHDMLRIMVLEESKVSLLPLTSDCGSASDEDLVALASHDPSDYLFRKVEFEDLIKVLRSSTAGKKGGKTQESHSVVETLLHQQRFELFDRVRFRVGTDLGRLGLSNTGDSLWIDFSERC
jgi:hypothetical protein